MSRYDVFTQGTIFSCARAEAYPECDVHGLVITARCDAAHGKANMINYVPVVRFEDLMLLDGARISARRVARDAEGSMKAALQDVGMTPDILDTQSPTTILAVLQENGDRRAAQSAERFSKAVTLRDRALSLALGHATYKETIAFLNDQAKTSNALIKELLSHSIADYHYLESVEPSEDAHGYVAMLREIRFLPTAVASAVMNGLDRDGLKALIRDDASTAEVQLSIENDDAFAMPLSTVRSPDIEFIVQRLTQLFARVGVMDVERGRLQRLQNAVGALGTKAS